MQAYVYWFEPLSQPVEPSRVRFIGCVRPWMIARKDVRTHFQTAARSGPVVKTLVLWSSIEAQPGP